MTSQTSEVNSDTNQERTSEVILKWNNLKLHFSFLFKLLNSLENRVTLAKK